MQLNRRKIEAIIFDLGGVILNIDINGAFQKFRSIGVGLHQDGIEIIKNNGIFIGFEIGKTSPGDFRQQIRGLSQYPFSDEEFDTVWNSIILDFPIENIRFLEQIRTKYRTFLMSNTNQIHYEYYNKQLSDIFGHPSLDVLFEKAYYSHTSGMRKPDTEFFLHILQENLLAPEKTLFVDDFIENIEAARQVGLQTFHISNGNKILDLKAIMQHN
jgi:glucose-1-phosphatase